MNARAGGLFASLVVGTTVGVGAMGCGPRSLTPLPDDFAVAAVSSSGALGSGNWRRVVWVGPTDSGAVELHLEASYPPSGWDTVRAEFPLAADARAALWTMLAPLPDSKPEWDPDRTRVGGGVSGLRIVNGGDTLTLDEFMPDPWGVRAIEVHQAIWNLVPQGMLDSLEALADSTGPDLPPDGIRFSAPYDSVALGRTACFGTCPEYAVVLRRSGRLTYAGVKHTTRIGLYEGTVPGDAFERIAEALQQEGFAAFADRYEVDATDHPSTCIITYGPEPGQTHGVVDYGGQAPAGFGAIAAAIDALVAVADWDGVEPEAPLSFVDCDSAVSDA
ncbi:MAG: DUF6438 domain-containing protein [Gemmatimonadota bacterium]